ncbi:hypothetical protein M9H77_35634 [Catharanthus roseus]|uniref:Uncharacterized protein n=1 Tax=Catharanthus roseus TaxID=4058 RepID=A0ACB9ZQG7_CATRO|nr:hypothetical protein M9H77_35634 [Catharanthus roseus]
MRKQEKLMIIDQKIIARNEKYAPIDITNWRLMVEDRLLDILKAVKVTYSFAMKVTHNNDISCSIGCSRGSNDSFAQGMGDERNDRERMMGLGVTPNDLWRKVPSKKISYRVFQEQQTMLEKLDERYQEQGMISKARGENGEYAIYDTKPQSKWLTMNTRGPSSSSCPMP